jgi:uncharacterized protein (TIGR02996 family)
VLCRSAIEERGAVNEEDSFVQAILASPGEATPRLIFADWLEERGDPRSEYIRLGCQVEALPADDPCRKLAIRRKQALLRADPGILVVS